MEKNKRIRHVEHPGEGPMDGVIMATACVCTKFEEEKIVNQDGPNGAHITASVEMGIFSIRDVESDIMLTISFEDVVDLIAEAFGAAAEKSKGAQS